MITYRTLYRGLVVSGLSLGGLAVMGGTAVAGPTGAIACGAIITVNTTLKKDVGPCSGDGLRVTGSNITINLNGHQIFATNRDSTGIHLMNVTGVMVKGGTVAGFDAGVLIEGGSANTITRVTVQNNREGIRIEGSGPGGHIVEKNTAMGNRLAGIALHGALNTTVHKNTSSDNTGRGILVSAGSANNILESNVVDNNGGGGIFVRGGAAANVLTNIGPPVLERVSPDRRAYVEGTDYRVMSGSGSGDVIARLVAIDVALNPAATAVSNPNPVDTSTSGCEVPTDYIAAGFQPGDVALIQRGTCIFEDKVVPAILNGASAVVMFNEGQAPDRTTFAFGALDVNFYPIPVLSTTYAVGFELYNLTRVGPVSIHLGTNTDNRLVEVGPPGANNNTMSKNTGLDNFFLDAFDLNVACGDNRWIDNVFERVFPPCIDFDLPHEGSPGLGATSDAY